MPQTSKPRFPWNLTTEEIDMATSRATKRAPRRAAAKKSARAGGTTVPAKRPGKTLAREADQKAKHGALERQLEPTAKRINAHLEKAKTADGKADDHRVSAAVLLAGVKEKCDADQLNFKNWVEAHVTEYGYHNARKLAQAGAQDDPKLAIEDIRSRGAAANRKLRENKKADVGKLEKSDPAGKKPPKTSYIDALDATLDGVGDKAERSYLEGRASKQGQVLISKADAKRLQGVKDGKLDALKEAFSFLGTSDQMKFLAWAAAECGVEVKSDKKGKRSSKAIDGASKDDMEIPAHLRRGKK